MTEREYYRETNTPNTPSNATYRRVEVAPASVPTSDEAAREVYQEQVYGPQGARVVRSEHISEPSPAERRAATAARVNQVVYFLFGIINVLIAIRFVLLALGASQASDFVRLIYGLTQPFVAPFLGIFGEPVIQNSVIEWASLVAIVIYSLLAYGISRLLAIAFTPSRNMSQEL
ncbi:MAG: hypothetical protein OHK0022_20820 [Roseiflexaceae bacterium]